MVIGLSILATASACVMLALRWEPVLLKATSLGEYIEDPLTVAAQSILVIIGFMAVLVMADRRLGGRGAHRAQGLPALRDVPADPVLAGWHDDLPSRR